MRFKSRKTNGYIAYAVSGQYAVSFAIDPTEADTKGLLGFALERHDLTENERYFVSGFKVFQELVPFPDQETAVLTFNHPVQSFVWDDLTAKPDHRYEYYFYPLKGQPKNIDRTASPIRIAVRTEPLFTDGEHDVFFNRGIASSQAYARRFNNRPPDALQGEEKQAALDWLSRDLEKALLQFIGQAKKGDTLLACFYEFRYLPVARAFREAIDRQVDVRIIVDAKDNSSTDAKGVFHASFPREDNLAAIQAAGIPAANILLRQASANSIQHNKFIVLLPGSKSRRAAVWTGSTNISTGGIFGQTNVGHWVRNNAVADGFRRYWEILSQDPGGREGDERAVVLQKNKEFRLQVEAISPGIRPEDVPALPRGVTLLFSPRQGKAVLDSYAAMLDQAKGSAFITLAFGVSAVFKDVLKYHKRDSALTFMLLEKKDEATAKNKDTFVELDWRHNIYQAWGNYFRDPLYQWTKEVNTQALGLNLHVKYVHSKFLLMDPLGADPVVVTGSANFSEPSTTSNDENMLVIRGDRRVADIYFTEFNRLFNHYYFRAIYEDNRERAGTTDTAPSLFLDPTDGWLSKYNKGSFRWKRVQMFAGMEI